MIVTDRIKWQNEVIKRHVSLSWLQTKHSKIAWAGGRMVAVWDYSKNRGMVV